MIISKAISLIFSNSCKSFPSFISPKYHFATSIIEQLITKNESEIMFRSTNLNFKSDLYSMYIYFVQPNCTPIINSYSDHLYRIHGDKAVVFTFYPNTVEGMQEGSYDLRKSIILSFKDIPNFLQIVPFSSNKTEIYRKFQDDKTYIRRLTLLDKPQQKSFNIHVSASSIQQNQNKQDHLWELDFPIKYPQYRVFIEYLKKNLTYISGIAMMLEKSKQEELNKVKDQQWIRKK